MHRAVAVSTLAAALAVTGGTAVAIARPSAHTTVQVGSSSAAPSTTTPGADHRRPSRFDHLHEVLAGLVAKGTITQAQADAVEAAMASGAHPNHRPGGPRGGDLMGMLREGIKPVADAIGITPEQLLTELRSGKSIADVAKAHGVSEAKVVAAIEAQATKRIDEAVSKGHLTSDQAVKIKSKLHDLITKVVEHTGGPMPFGGGPFGGRRGPEGHGPSTSSPPTTGPATSSPPSTSAPSTSAPSTSAAPATTAAPTTAPPTTN